MLPEPVAGALDLNDGGVVVDPVMATALLDRLHQPRIEAPVLSGDIETAWRNKLRENAGRAGMSSTGRQLLERLQAAHPGGYPDDILRTVQRRVKVWRREKATAMVFGELPSADSVADRHGKRVPPSLGEKSPLSAAKPVQPGNGRRERRGLRRVKALRASSAAPRPVG